ncbi:MAG: 3'-5' exonuclease [Candidatus Omnitrophota bacterium]
MYTTLRRHSISKTEINALPLKHYTGSIHVIDSDEKMRAAVRSLGRENVLGFDTETRPAFKKGESYPPSIFQLAASDGVYIFQIGRIDSHKPLADILANQNVLKAGISVSDDIKKLNDVLPFNPSGFIELAGMAAKAGIRNAGIRGLAALLFGFRISKQTRCSRWDSPTLKHTQVVYAATDAWICREIYFALLGILNKQVPGQVIKK